MATTWKVMMVNPVHCDARFIAQHEHRMHFADAFIARNQVKDIDEL
jgi:hypothetical protein